MSDETEAKQGVLRTALPVQQQLLSGKELRRMAVNGGFSVDEETGDKMIASLQAIVDSLEARWAKLQAFAERPKMSQTATGQWVSGLMLNTATDEKGLLTQLQTAKAELPAYIEAINLAKKNYQSQDHDTGHAVGRLRAVES
jgi:hypothetical protein